MKKLALKGFFLLSFLTGMVFSASAQTTTNQNVGVTALLGNFLSVTKVQDVHFGGIVIPGSPSTITMEKATGVVDVSAGDQTTFYSTNLITKGQIKIDTNSDTAFDVKYPQTLSLSGSNGGTIVYTPAAWAHDNNVDIPYSGVGTIHVNSTQQQNGYLVDIAGNLALLGTEKQGTYTGTLVVSVVWQ